jgi:hypothetical protein
LKKKEQEEKDSERREIEAAEKKEREANDEREKHERDLKEEKDRKHREAEWKRMEDQRGIGYARVAIKKEDPVVEKKAIEKVIIEAIKEEFKTGPNRKERLKKKNQEEMKKRVEEKRRRE